MAPAKPPTADDPVDPAKQARHDRAWRVVGLVMLVVAGVIACLFVGLVISDWVNYSRTVNSAPFSAFVLVRAMTILVPGIVVGLIGWAEFRRHPAPPKPVDKV